MTIASFDDWIGSTKQELNYFKSATMASVAGGWCSSRHLAGSPVGVLGGVFNTTDGVKPKSGTDSGVTMGCHPIHPFAPGARGYLARVEFGASGTAGVSRICLADILWAGGAFDKPSMTYIIGAPPSFADRLPEIGPGVPDYNGLAIWIEIVTVVPSTAAVTINYLNQDGNAAATTVDLGGFLNVGRTVRAILATGDAGVRSIVSVVTNANLTSGTFNVFVVRPLWEGGVPVANMGGVDDMLQTGLPEVFPESCLLVFQRATGTSVGTYDLRLQIASK